MVKYKLEYYLTRFVGLLARGLSPGAINFIGDRFGDLFFYVIKTRRKTALKNLTHVFGKEKTADEINRIIHLNYRHFGRTMIEFARTPLLNRKNILEKVPVQNQEILHEALSQGKGVLVLSGHFGNWEYLASAVAQIGPPMYAVFKEQKNLLVDDLIKEQRVNMGLLPLKVKGGAARGIIMALRENAKVLILFDQDAGGKGRFIDFLGRPASTTEGPAKIAIKHKIPCVLAMSYRGKKHGIRIKLEKFIKEYNSRLEKYIRKYPEQWFWMHRRWLTWERHEKQAPAKV
ncbi:hypothetical protein B6I21_04775 [candidate division KSB1 bacterium 4572_119]|nr:MAG: hypothetical protein B6I21_04775 [candidate division KSB1 bacterium 4572_119]